MSTSEVSKKNSINIYPNPAVDFLSLTKISDKATYKIYSEVGQLVSTGIVKNKKIDVSSLAKGVYVIRVSDIGKEVLNTKFIKK